MRKVHGLERLDSVYALHSCIKKFSSFRQGLIAVNYAARAAGVAKRMRVQDAKKICPQLCCVHVQVLGVLLMF
jgi:nucleotidyltransferase/DNA polymerase involved in DNA repair